MMTANDGRLFLALIRAVARLALPPSEQLSYLESIGVGEPADELASEFHDGVLLIPRFVDAGWLTAAEIQLLRELDSVLDSMSGPKDQLWHKEGLKADPRWDSVRQKAGAFLFLQGQ